MSGTSPDVSVVIVNWNTASLLRQCLASVGSGAGGTCYEVVLIDNASRDGSQAMVRTEFPEVTLLANTTNRGFAAACNQGMRLARGRYILLLNSDTQLPAGTLACVVRFADEKEDVGVVGCAARYPDGRPQSTCFRFYNLQYFLIVALGLHRLFPRALFFNRHRYKGLDQTKVQEVDIVAGVFMLVRREALHEVGMLDTSYFMYGEDADWCWRFCRAGWKVVFFPGAEIIHHHGASASQQRSIMERELRRSQLFFVDRAHGWPAAWLANVILAGGDLARSPWWILQWVFRRSKRDSGPPASQWVHLRRLLFHLGGLLQPSWRSDALSPSRGSARSEGTGRDGGGELPN
ncbi:MAG TPA: glycosyltransferase family 2 protein [Phycisphaerae bacterium]|nr:glycosyltransferase family 2 protein [Phycisphaerae bacterium]